MSTNDTSGIPPSTVAAPNDLQTLVVLVHLSGLSGSLLVLISIGMPIWAAVLSARGETVRYPLILRLIA